MPARPPALPARSLRQLLAIAREVVRATAPRLERGSWRALPARRKGPGDYVTARDVAIEHRVRSELRRRDPRAGWLGEETGAERLDAERVWLCDPIDGTSNFARGLPLHGIALACLHAGMPVAAALYCLPERALYSAAAGLGAWRSRQRLRLRPATLGPASIVGVQWLRTATKFPQLAALARSGTRMRNFGCTVAHFCELAAGRLDANVQQQGRIWDLAGPALLVTEAGGIVSDWRGKPLLPFRTLAAGQHFPTLAAPPRLHGKLLRLLQRVPLVVPTA